MTIGLLLSETIRQMQQLELPVQRVVGLKTQAKQQSGAAAPVPHASKPEMLDEFFFGEARASDLSTEANSRKES